MCYGFRDRNWSTSSLSSLENSAFTYQRLSMRVPLSFWPLWTGHFFVLLTFHTHTQRCWRNLDRTQSLQIPLIALALGLCLSCQLNGYREELLHTQKIILRRRIVVFREDAVKKPGIKKCNAATRSNSCHCHYYCHCLLPLHCSSCGKWPLALKTTKFQLWEG